MYSSSQTASPLRELTYRMGSHSVTYHPAEVTFPPLPQLIKDGTQFIDPGEMQESVYIGYNVYSMYVTFVRMCCWVTRRLMRKTTTLICRWRTLKWSRCYVNTSGTNDTRSSLPLTSRSLAVAHLYSHFKHDISIISVYFTVGYSVPSVLWYCWLGSRKGIRPVENWVVGCWHGYLVGRGADLHMAQLMPLPLTISCPVNPNWFY